jgi:hypothetical protein
VVCGIFRLVLITKIVIAAKTGHCIKKVRFCVEGCHHKHQAERRLTNKQVAIKRAGLFRRMFMVSWIMVV